MVLQLITKWGILSLCLLVFVPAEAQYKFQKAVHLTTKDGLVGNHSTDVTQDDDGFIWITTSDGLCRFDGQEFRVFRHDPENPASLLDNNLHFILADGRYIWIATQVGLSRLDRYTETFRHYQFTETGKRDTLIHESAQQIRALYRDRNGEIWIGTRNMGLARYNRRTDDFQMYRADIADVPKRFPAPGEVHSILGIEQHRSDDSIIWAGTGVGLIEVNKFTGTVVLRSFLGENPEDDRWINSFRRMCHQSDGLLYYGSWGGRLYTYDPLTETAAGVSLAGYPTFDFPITSIASIRVKNKREIWVTTGSGLFSFDTGTRKITFLKRRDALQNYGITHIDNQNRVWTTSVDGLYIFDPILQQFVSYSYQAFIKNAMGLAFNMYQPPGSRELLVACRGAPGLLRFDRFTQTWSLLSLPPSAYTVDGYFYCRDAAVRSDGSWWIAGPSTILEYRPDLRKVKTVPGQPPLKDYIFNSLIWDRQDRLWLSTNTEGLWRWDARTGQWESFDRRLFAHDDKTLSKSVGELFEDSNGNIWFARDKAFGVFPASGETLRQFYYENEPDAGFATILSFAEDAEGRVWMSSQDGWLGYAHKDRPEKGIVKKINLNGLVPRHPKFSVFYMQTDGNGDIWGVAGRLLVKIEARPLKITTHSFAYGEEDPDFFSLEILPDGLLAFGGRNRIVVADPADLQRNEERPRPYLTQINIREQPLGGDRAPFFVDRLDLRPRENFFSLEFSAQGFTLGRQNRFRYRLKGFEDEWIDAKERRYANYTNVPGGPYVFQLQAANNEGVWNEEIFELPIRIAIPWWKQIWFFFAFAGLLTFLLFQGYHFRIAQIRKEEKRKSDFERQLAAVEMSALRAQMNPHFLFNCLNSIDRFIIRNETKKASEYLNGFARLIRLILQNSRSNYVNLKDELEALELYLQMESMRFNGKFRYRFSVSDQLDVAAIDIPPMLIQPYVENAVWHGLMHKEDKEEGLVTLSVNRTNGLLQIVVEDNGIGREQAAEIKAQSSRSHGKSVGMRITSDRINLMNKLYNFNTTVTVTDLKDDLGQAAGTRVELTIPL